MGFFNKIFGRSEPSNEMAAAGLANKAFHLVEQGKYDSAIELLRQAIKIDPLCGDAYNELAFIYGRVKSDLDLAEEYARLAVECDPGNPKFYNAINGIQLMRVKRLRTRREIRESVGQRLQEIQHNIDKAPSYPPAYLAKATVLALNGEPTHIWEAELRHAEELYSQRSISAAGLPLTPDLVSNIITRNHNLCLEMSSYWASLPEG